MKIFLIPECRKRVHGGWLLGFLLFFVAMLIPLSELDRPNPRDVHVFVGILALMFGIGSLACLMAAFAEPKKC